LSAFNLFFCDPLLLPFPRVPDWLLVAAAGRMVHARPSPAQSAAATGPGSIIQTYILFLTGSYFSTGPRHRLTTPWLRGSLNGTAIELIDRISTGREQRDTRCLHKFFCSLCQRYSHLTKMQKLIGGLPLFAFVEIDQQSYFGIPAILVLNHLPRVIKIRPYSASRRFMRRLLN
jgi:hypothetical protein